MNHIPSLRNCSLASTPFSGAHQGQKYSITVQRGTPADEVTLNFPEQPADESTKTLRFLALVHSKRHAYVRTAATDEVLGCEMALFYEQREHILTRLESLNTRILESNEAYRLKLQSETDERRQKLQQDFDARAQQLDTDIRRREEALNERDADLKRRETEFDNRSSTHARRQIRQDVKKIIADRTVSFHLSGETTRKRWPIHALFLLLIASSTTLFAIALLGYLPLPSTFPAWFAAVRLPLITAAVAVSVVFYSMDRSLVQAACGRGVAAQALGVRH